MPPKPIESLTFKDNLSPRRLLVAFAHPDDESFGPAGTLIHYDRAGVAVHYVCGTRGEVGDVTPELMNGYQSVAERRTQELLCAAEVLGLTGLHFLNYRDSGMENSLDNRHADSLIQAPVATVAESITALMRRIKPQVVLTFDPSGGYFHPDHIHMHRATSLAFHAAGDAEQYPHQIEAGLQPFQPQKLYYTAFPRRFVRLIIRLMPLFGQDPTAFGRNKDINLQRIAAVESPITTKININPYFALSRQAANCHASQLPGEPPRLLRFLQRWFSRYNSYTRIIPPVEGRTSVENDLFAGVDVTYIPL
jgi:LmbE family N-acetylglucosaminyl deacetylase